ncbi:hypothetical protein GF386_03860 [Candidatus Pacearchaeota archaeon]|nr:hypothetical protein [Candidatus Pacearchaeota archaeon]MBD3283282.1 hypothetical protein [Candidatus Pacearchaeota archaeon]
MDDLDEPPPDNLRKYFDSLGFSEANRTSVWGWIKLLLDHSPTHGRHELRVLDMCYNLGDFIEKNGVYVPVSKNELVYGGGLHDTGKLLSDRRILEEPWDSRDQHIGEMRQHPLNSYYLLIGKYGNLGHQDLRVHAYSALVGLFHHKFHQRDRYPKKLPRLGTPFSAGTIKRAESCSRLVALADIYAAAVYRSGNLDHEEALKMLADNADSCERDLLWLMQLRGCNVFRIAA